MHLFSCAVGNKTSMKNVSRTLALILLSGTTTFIPLLRATTCIFCSITTLITYVYKNFFTINSAYIHLHKSISRHPVVLLKNDELPYATLIHSKKWLFNFSLPLIFYSSKFRNIFLFPFCIFKRFSICVRSNEIIFDQRL